MKHGFPSSRRGFILLSVLLISSLLLGASVTFAWFARQEMRRVASEEFAMVSRSLAVIAAATAGGWIAGDTNAFDSHGEFLYSQSLPLMLMFDEWMVSIRITPLDHRFPVNAIFLPDGVTLKKEMEHPWEEIWTYLGRPEIGPVVLDFLDRDSDARPGSREDEDTFVNGTISDLSELLRLDEITPALLYGAVSGDTLAEQRLDRFFTIYCDDKINVNVAPREVLAILDQDMDAYVADSILQYRQINPIADMKDLLKIPGFPAAANARIGNMVGFKSNYFLLQLQVLHGSRERNFDLVMRRGDNSCSIVKWSG